MEITRVTVEILDTPLESGYVAAGNAVSSNYHILSRIETKGGVQGIGFAVATRPALVKSVASAARELGQLLPWLNVLEREAARAKMLHAGGWAGPGGVLTIAMATLDIALWDAAGKIMGQPLYRMLGGHRDRVRAYASDGLWYSLSLAELARNAKAHVSAGYDKIKLRLGHEERPAGEVARVRAVQDAVGPDVDIMIDGTQSWNEAQAAVTGRALQDAGIVWLEDPVHHEDVGALARLAASLEVPIAAGENLYGMDAFEKTLEAHAVDIAIIDLARAGGVTP
jgi:L-alanine-DL-glutamate epimerase-like enolase superfamily enzyme